MIRIMPLLPMRCACGYCYYYVRSCADVVLTGYIDASMRHVTHVNVRADCPYGLMDLSTCCIPANIPNEDKCCILFLHAWIA